MKLEKLADAVSSFTFGKTDVELETLHALQDLMEELTHPESECLPLLCSILTLVPELSGLILGALVNLDIVTDTTVLSWWKDDQSYKEGKAMTICQAQQYLNWLEKDVEKGDQADAPPENRK